MQLNREIIQAPTAAELLALCQLRITELNAVNVATALNQLAKRRDARDAWPGKMSLLIDAAESFAKTGSGRELASMAW